jgi:hypothetical protein
VYSEMIVSVLLLTTKVVLGLMGTVIIGSTIIIYAVVGADECKRRFLH